MKILFTGYALLFSALLFGQWNTNPSQNNPVCTAFDEQTLPRIISDGSNGAIVVWDDIRDGISKMIYAQRFDASGHALWTANGILVCPGGNNQFNAKITSDGAGGVIVVFQDGRNSIPNQLYAQRIDGNGNLLWTNDGSLLCNAAGTRMYPDIAPDGSGGAVIAWQDLRSGIKVYAQRIDNTGTPQWTTNGVLVAINGSFQEFPKLVSDGNSGALISWRDRTSGPGTNNAIYAQRITNTGTRQWGILGTIVCANTMDPAAMSEITATAGGGAIVTWQDYRSLVYHVYAQCMNSIGQPQWTIDGVQICSDPGQQTNPRIIGDGNNGAIISWNDTRAGFPQIYAQRVDATGTGQWSTAGLSLGGEAISEYIAPVMLPDNTNGAIISWPDARAGDNNIYVQRVSNAGVLQWGTGGVAATINPAGQVSPAIAVNSDNSVIAAWVDYRNADADIYASRLLANGTLPVRLLSFYGTIENSHATLHWTTHADDDSRYFVVEKSSDGVSFQSIGQVNAQPGSGTDKSYTLTDPSAIAHTIYYRLKPVDPQGRFTYSSIIRISAANTQVVAVYPNPANALVTLTWPYSVSRTISIRVLNATGQVIKSVQETARPQIQLDVSMLPTGHYLLQITDGIHSAIQKVNINH